MKFLPDLIPNAADLLTLSDERLGYEILEVLVDWESGPQMFHQNREHFIGTAFKAAPFGTDYGQTPLEAELKSAIARSWDFLVREGYLIRDA